jgi:hypothetical protein
MLAADLRGYTRIQNKQAKTFPNNQHHSSKSSCVA